MIAFRNSQLIDACPHDEADVFIIANENGLHISWEWTDSRSMQVMIYSRVFTFAELRQTKLSAEDLLSDCTYIMNQDPEE